MKSHMTDKQLVDFVEKHGIQIWPMRQVKHGPVLQWWVQRVSPFLQLARPKLRDALKALADKTL